MTQKRERGLMSGLSRENGDIIVEATFVYPIMFMILIVLFYSAIILCQKANLQANLQTALLYFKNVESDNYLVINDANGYRDSDGSVSAVRYGDTKLLIPYSNIFMSFNRKNTAKFDDFFHDISGRYFFYDTSDIEVEAKHHNYLVCKTIEATATQTIHIPFVKMFANLLGLDSDIVISSTATVVVQDTDEFIRRSDVVAELIARSKLGEKIDDMWDKVDQGYDKIKEVLGVE